MKWMTKLATAILLSCVSLISHANLISFDLRSPEIESLDGTSSFEYMMHGLVATIQSNVGVLNRTSSGFGVDIVGSGCDNSDAIDRSCADTSGEMVSVWFDKPVELVSVRLSGLTGGDTAGWILPNLESIFITVAGEYFVDDLVHVEPGVSFSVMSAADNITATQRGFSFDGFTLRLVNSEAIDIDEPSTLFTILIGLVFLLILSRVPLPCLKGA